MKRLVLGVLLAASGFAQKVQVESDPAVDFTKFKTFTIRQAHLNSKNPALNGELVRKRIDFDIQKYLTAKKLTYVEQGPGSQRRVHPRLGSRRPARGIPRGVARLGNSRGSGALYGRHAGDRSARSQHAIASVPRHRTRRQERRRQGRKQARRHGQKGHRQIPAEREVDRRVCARQPAAKTAGVTGRQTASVPAGASQAGGYATLWASLVTVVMLRNVIGTFSLRSSRPLVIFDWLCLTLHSQ